MRTVRRPLTALLSAALLLTAASAGMEPAAAEPSPPADPTVAAENAADLPLANGGFEDGPIDPVTGWAIDGTVWENQAIGLTDALAHGGTRSLRIEDDNAVRGVSLQSEPFGVQPGIVYEASAWMNLERGPLGLYVRYFDADGNRLVNQAVWADATGGEWQELTSAVAAPAGAATGTVLLNSSTAGLGSGYVDDVAMVATDQVPPPPPLPPRPTPEQIVAQNPNLTHLGAPVSSRIITNMVLGEEDGISMTYGVYRGNAASGSPATLVVADTATGAIVRTIPLAGTDHATEIRRSTDGRIYMVTSNLTLWTYDPATHEARNIGLINPASPSDGYGWSLADGPDGTMYIGTYPQGLLFRYDPADDSITNLGRVDETQAYIRALAYDHERGNLYVGVGGSSAQIYKIGADGTKTALLTEENAPGAGDESFITSFTFVGDRLFARLNPSRLTVITAADEVEFIGADRSMFGYNVAQRPDDPNTYIFTTSTFWEYNALTQEVRNTGVPSNGFLNDSRWVERDDPQWPGWTLEAATGNGVAAYNPDTGQVTSAAIGYTNPVTVQKLFVGPDSMYASGYMVGLAPFDSVTGEHGTTVQAGQYESSAVRDGRLLLGAYGNGRLMEYDPVTGANPRQIFSLEAEDQDRPFGLDYDPVGDRIFMGTVAHYGRNQGALTVYEFATDTKTVYTDEIVTEQSVIDVLYHDGLVYLGTTIDGGLGAPPSGQTDAHFIVFDPDTGQVVRDLIPVAGDEGVTGLLLGPDGLIWGVSEDTVFKYDHATGEIVYSEKLLAARYGTATVWAHAYLTVGADGNVYGSNRFTFFRIDPQTMEHTTIVNGVGSYAVADEAGDVLFSTGAQVFTYDVPEPVTPQDVLFTDLAGPARDRYTIPDVEGVEYLVAGEVAPAGVHAASGEVSVTAVATEGHVITDGATSAWSHSFQWRRVPEVAANTS
ncbi:hypothetical protein [Occultella kanbiaonis]|uniref:hypothetical protein n=1 Tax=Occultella kanbiaonis TaxID=2675754 RepID=UPI0013D3F093|nr:hypothetical protein [Occultella kanbiaonis]